MKLQLKPDIGQMYAEYILHWMMENAPDGRPIEDFEMQDGSGLPDFEFRVGIEWLVKHQLLDHQNQEFWVH